jgi:hypothetical protein
MIKKMKSKGSNMKINKRLTNSKKARKKLKRSSENKREQLKIKKMKSKGSNIKIKMRLTNSKKARKKLKRSSKNKREQ